MRHTLSLAGTWEFQLDPDGYLTPDTLAPDREIAVPLPWQAAFPELARYGGYAWYRRHIQLDSAWRTGAVWLHFGAVDYWCEVYVNGRRAGGHEGGYTPFDVPVAHLVRDGDNEIVVRVYDVPQTGMTEPRWPAFPAEPASPGPPFDPNNIPHGKQEWYINVGGIWQDVTLTATTAAYIDHVRVTTDIGTGAVRIDGELAGPPVTEGVRRIRASIGPGEAGNVEVSLGADGRVFALGLQVELAPAVVPGRRAPVRPDRDPGRPRRRGRRRRALRFPRDSYRGRTFAAERRAPLLARGARPGLLS